ncbi:MAG TPA: AI-2E family transporter [Gaiellaceae bacterium]|nr:AI-2E family transporter [Gaiellaceae bacterium]
MTPERLVHFRPRTILTALLVLLGVGIVLYVLWISRQVISWVLVALFLALALNPAVEWLNRNWVRRRGAAVGIAFVAALVVVGGLAAAFIPTLIDQVAHFSDAVPGYVHDLTHGRGRLGFLETKYHIVEKVRHAIKTGGAGRVLGVTGTALAVTKSVLTAVVAILTIIFMTLFMLLEGPSWVERFYGLLPEAQRPRWRAVGHDIYRTVGGYVTGNLLISLIAGVASGILLFAVGVPYAVALGLLVALLDLIPLAGATIAAVIVTLIAFAANGLTAGIVVAVFFVVYQQVENHVLQPLVYGRTVQLSPLAVLISVLIGAQVAGVLGALAAIPVAGAIQVVLVDWHRHRRARLLETPAGAGTSLSS